MSREALVLVLCISRYISIIQYYPLSIQYYTNISLEIVLNEYSTISYNTAVLTLVISQMNFLHLCVLNILVMVPLIEGCHPCVSSNNINTMALHCVV